MNSFQVTPLRMGTTFHEHPVLLPTNIQHIHNISLPRHLLHITEPGPFQHAPGLLPAPHGAQPLPTVRKTHSHTVRQADRVQEAPDGVRHILIRRCVAVDVLHEEHPIRSEKFVDEGEGFGWVGLVVNCVKD